MALRSEQETSAGEALRLELGDLIRDAEAAAARYEWLQAAAVEPIAHRVLQRLQRPLGRLARPAVSARAEITAEADRAYQALPDASAGVGQLARGAWGWPRRALAVEIRPMSVWGVPAPASEQAPVVGRTLASRGMPPGAAGASVVAAADHFERLVDQLIRSAPREMLLLRLGQALSRTTRQVNVLEQRLTPRLRHQLGAVRRRLEEREREEHVRLERLRGRTSRRSP